MARTGKQIEKKQIGQTAKKWKKKKGGRPELLKIEKKPSRWLELEKNNGKSRLAKLLKNEKLGTLTAKKIWNLCSKPLTLTALEIYKAEIEHTMWSRSEKNTFKRPNNKQKQFGSLVRPAGAARDANLPKKHKKKNFEKGDWPCLG